MRRMGRRRTQDSSLAYFVNQLENLDRTLYQPLVSVTWGRDIKLRPGITMSNESTSFIQSTLAGAGTLSNSQGNMPWLSQGGEAAAIPGISVNGQKISTPLRLLAREVSYTSVELDRSQLLGTPIDQQKIDGMNLLYQMNIDQMVYVGSNDVSATGLLNNASVSASLVANGATGSTLWTSKTPDEIVYDVNSAINTVWAASGYAIVPTKIIVPPVNLTYIASQKVSSAGNISILKYLKENCITLTVHGQELDIQPVKWAIGEGSDSTNRMTVYTNDLNRVRFPMVPIRRETAYYQGIRYAAPYLYAFGQVEFVYPETVGYFDGI